MIGKISGLIDDKGADHLLVDVGGVGLVVHCSERTLSELPGRGHTVSLYTELVVREDLLQLIGFRSRAEREWHRLLTRVQGVGHKAGLAIVGTLGSEGLFRAVSLKDTAAIRAAPGVGPKLAQRIISELKEESIKIIGLGADGEEALEPSGDERAPQADAGAVEKAGDATPKTAAVSAQARKDAMSALINLGYAHGEAAEAIASVSSENPELDSSGLIRAALKYMAPRD